MTPSKPFLLTLAVVAVGAVGILATPRPSAAAAAPGLPLSTTLTPTMIDYFGLDAAYERPSIPALVACASTPGCGNSDSSRVRFTDLAGHALAAYDGKPGTRTVAVRRSQTTRSDGAAETRVMRRVYSQDDKAHVIMNGSDSIVTIDRGGAGRDAATLVRLHRYSDVRYDVNDPRFPWPLMGMVVLELSNTIGSAQSTPVPAATHGAVSFDGTAYAHVLTAGALTHRVNLQAKLLETTLPDR